MRILDVGFAGSPGTQMKAHAVPSGDLGGRGPGRQLVWLAVLALPVAGVAALAAHALQALIALITQLCFHAKFSIEWSVPGREWLGAWIVLVPALGGGVIALLARFGSRAIIGHGIPEVMQQVLAHRSRISPRVALLKPLSSAISIGTGGPYGAEGPVIACGSAVGSLFGQLLTMTGGERKILLAAGAAAAMTTVFGSPVAATLLAMELLLFEFRLRSLLPVALAAVVAQALRLAWGEPDVLFAMPDPGVIASPFAGLAVFFVIGAAMGVLAVATNHLVHRIETLFTRLPVHWMWCPVIGGGCVGMVGWYEPRVLGAGYGVIADMVAGHLPLAAICVLAALKLVAWSVSLGSGTSGGTLAPMLIIGGGAGAIVGAVCSLVLPGVCSPSLAAVIGMAAFFAGGSRAYFASIVLVLEMTRRAAVLWPVAVAATVAVGVARLLSAGSIMSSPVESRGVLVPQDLDVDAFVQVQVGEVMEEDACVVPPGMAIAALADRVSRHDPEVCRHSAVIVVDEAGRPLGVVTRRDLLGAIARGLGSEDMSAVMSRELIVAYPDELLQGAVQRMHQYDIGRLPVVSRSSPGRLVGYLGRSAVLGARRLRWQVENETEIGWLARPRSPRGSLPPPQ